MRKHLKLIVSVIVIYFILSGLKVINLTPKKIVQETFDKMCDYKLISNQHQIIPNLWIGNYKAALDKDYLQKNNIKLIINLSKDIEFTDLDIEKHRVFISDNRSMESDIGMITEIPKLFPILDNHMKKNNGILIHCRAGMQRSAGFMAIYLMRRLNKKFDYIKNMMRKKRCIVFYPFVNFIGPIKYYEAKLNI